MGVGAGVCACVHVCVRACVHACMCVCMQERVCVCVSVRACAHVRVYALRIVSTDKILRFKNTYYYYYYYYYCDLMSSVSVSQFLCWSEYPGTVQTCGLWQ